MFKLVDYNSLVPRLISRGKEGDLSAIEDAFQLVRSLEKEGAVTVIGGAGARNTVVHDPKNFDLAHSFSGEIRSASSALVRSGAGGKRMLELNKMTLLFDAPYDFDAAIRYAEWNRPFEKKFYEPRRKQLLPAVKGLQAIADREIKLLIIEMPPGAGKSTLEIMFLRWWGGMHPELGNLVGSHSNAILQGMYGELQRMCDPEGEYLWQDIFPDAPLVGTDAKNMQLDLGSRKRFGTYQFASVGSGNAGRVRASGVLCLDDLVPDLESAMSRERMDKLWQQYNTDYLQRMIGDCAQILIQTPWSLHDPIDRLADMHHDDPECRVIKLPALDENDESNFDYPNGVGFTTEMYHQIREVMDDASWRALYMLEPVEREGQLYAPEELRRYFELPPRDPDAIIAVADTKNKGDDYFVMPVAYQYGQDFYIDRILCDNSKPEIVDERAVSLLCETKCEMARYESNNAGGRIAENAQKALKERGSRCRITTKWNESNKETRIVISSPWVKEHCLFKDESLIKADKDYRTALQFLFGYSMAGGRANRHDDVPDAFASLYDFVSSFEMNSVTIVKRPF